MRELVFSLDYEPGCNEVADALAAHPQARIRSLSLHATAESLWRVDHVTGPAEALAAVEDAFLTADYYADCLATEDCGARQETQVLDSADDTLVLYSYWERAPACASVPHIALDFLGDGLLFETRNEARQYTWRIVHAGDGDVRAFFDAIEENVGECADLEVERLTEAASPSDAPRDEGDLPPEQDQALRAAVEHGYYETPREVDVGDLAETLGVPRSTLTYRLRRAEAHLAERRVAESRSTASPSTRL
ncbi:helix-turn-helix domain-containing protein [Halosimplex amylolyticum]|uniref:helix-turn-helix domain-containing protein n=1 Tax=Halosimplex amylolyticum TaxID=3396616 RepID=UPI003F577CB4